jgi:hypothetical protein
MAIDIRNALTNRAWQYRSVPYPHFQAQEVFQQDTYRGIENAVQELIDRGLSDTHSPQCLSRNLGEYDAYSMLVGHPLNGPLAIFSSRQWHDLLRSLLGIQATGDVQISVHHHQPGSRAGWIHNDLNPGWFPADIPADGINLGDVDTCCYKTGQVFAKGLAARKTVRSGAMLFYLGNQDWEPGWGGETGLFEQHSPRLDHPYTKVPPLNNSLLVFECTPYSFHAFLGNNTAPRTSIVMWLHTPYEEASARWGETSIVEWRSP